MRLRNILILLVILLALGGYYYTRPPQAVPQPPPRVFVWDIDMEAIKHIKIELPRQGQSQSFIKIKEPDKFPWYFDDPQRSNVDTQRWGGGIPLILSGPGAVRPIAFDATEEKLAEFGLTEPQMVITLTLENEDVLTIAVGYRTPNGQAHYVQAPGTRDVALVDYTWYEVLGRLVTEPPYLTP